MIPPIKPPIIAPADTFFPGCIVGSWLSEELGLGAGDDVLIPLIVELPTKIALWFIGGFGVWSDPSGPMKTVSSQYKHSI